MDHSDKCTICFKDFCAVHLEDHACMSAVICPQETNADALNVPKTRKSTSKGAKKRVASSARRKVNKLSTEYSSGDENGNETQPSSNNMPGM